MTHSITRLSVLILLVCIAYSPGVTQGFLHGLECSAGFSAPKQDRRLFDASFAEKYNKDLYEKTTNDHQFDFLISKTVNLKNPRVLLLPGVGYSHFRARYNWYYNANYFGDGFQVYHTVDTYTYHMAAGQVVLGYHLIHHDHTKFSFILPLRCNMLVNKEMLGNPSEEDHYNRTKIELQSLEINPGLRFTIGRVTSSVTYRMMNLQKIDHVIIDETLFYDDHDPYLSRKYDDYNIRKFSFTLGYMF